MSQIVTRTAAIRLNGAPDQVFPLFTALGEYHWIPGWSPTLIYPPSGEPMTHNVFVTQHGDQQTIWVAVDYDLATQHVEYVNVTPGLTSVHLDIQCRAADGGTEAQISHTVIALAEAGYAEVEHSTEAAFAERMQQWQHAINDFLAHHALIPQH